MKMTVKSNFDERYDESCLEKIQERLNDDETLFVVGENDGSPEISLHTVCGQIVNGSAEIKDGQIYYEIKIFNSDVGRAVKSIINGETDNISAGITCIGKVTEDDKVDAEDLSVVKGYLENSGNSNIVNIE
jgi:hypothetical protein